MPNCGDVRLLYLGESRHLSKANRGGGANDSWDRKHVWPKSRGFKKQSQDGYTDTFIIYDQLIGISMAVIATMVTMLVVNQLWIKSPMEPKSTQPLS
jgi:hypothetical protein